METLKLVGEVITSIVGTITICSFIFCKKSEVNDKVLGINKTISQNQLNSEQHAVTIKDDLLEKMDTYKNSLEAGMQEFIKVLSEIKEADKNLSLQFITLLNSVKDELRNDYTNKYNELLVLINGKVNESEFSRLEQKVDKVSETITELKTIIQMKREEKSL